MNKTILLGHGSGGLMTHELISKYFLRHFDNDILRGLTDSALLRVEDTSLAFTTDSFVVDPVFFPGGDIGKLAVCGTVNDLAVSGARPLFLSAAFILEEGFPLEELEVITASMAGEATRAQVQIVTGDTKVVKRGQCDRIFINTAGIGIIDPKNETLAGGELIEAGDQILVNGYLGDHEMAILSARENLQFETPVISDVTPLNHLIYLLLNAGVDIHFMRDITRGGLATVLAEMTGARKFGVEFSEQKLPIRQEVLGLCEVYGFNPLYLANEGKVLLVVSSGTAEKALTVMQQTKEGREARQIGIVTAVHPGRVVMQSITGGTRLIDKLAGEQLPRIC